MTNLHDIKSARETDNLKNDPQIIEIKRIVDWLNDPACSCSLALEDIYNGDKDLAEAMRGQARGAFFAATYFANSAGYEDSDGFAQAQFEISLPILKATMKNQFSNEIPLNEGDIGEYMINCTALTKIQAEIIQEAREKQYGKDTSNNVWIK